MALENTPAAADAESYADLEFADDYFALTTRQAEWDAIGSEAAKENALREAMPFIESQAWIGTRATASQALEWPRQGGRRLRWQLSIGGITDLRGRPWPSSEIPAPIMKAQCEMALAVFQDASWTTDTDDVQSIRTGVVTISKSSAAGRKKLPSLVQQWLDGLVIAQAGAVRLIKA